jgi:ATP-dependent helicase/nuclease subunit B
LRHAVSQALAARADRRAAADPQGDLFAAAPRQRETERASEAARTLSPWDWAAAGDIAERVATALAPLERLGEADGHVALPALVEAHCAALLAAAGDRRGGAAALFADEAGEALSLALEELKTNAAAGPDLLPRDYPGLFAALIERSLVRRRGGLDPRIHIWGTLEARLQSVDVIVLGGLNEGVWPGQTRLDPLLSRAMRGALALEPPEQRIGLSAHDFAEALGQAEVWLTRAERVDGEPRVASRWLQRLTAYAGERLAGAMRERGGKMLAIARHLDQPTEIGRAERPHPSPPPELRPRKLSATRIETLIRDPYAIYAREVLRLRPIEPLGKLPDAADRGTLIHAVLENFVRERPSGPFDAAAEERLLAIGRAEFARHADFPEVIALWWPRFERIARWFVRVEAARADVAERHVEGTGRLDVTPDFVLTARADRIDRLTDGNLAVIDYKTGGPPSPDEVLSLSPQLLLEALIARRGGFEGIAAAEPVQIAYYQLSGRGEGGIVHARGTRAAKSGKPDVTLPQALAATGERLEALVAHFARPEAEYPSRKIPKRGRVFVGDYDHLARVAEWTVSEEEDDQ